MLGCTPRRILILGPNGSGKSTLARILGARLGLPIVHLDSEFWLPGFRKPEASDWLQRVEKLSTHARWIIDGDYLDTICPRLRRAEALIWLDFPRRVYMRRLICRILCQLGKERQDMGKGNRERLNLLHVARAFRYKTLKRPRLLAIVEQAHRLDKKVIVIRNQNELESLLSSSGNNLFSLCNPETIQ